MTRNGWHVVRMAGVGGAGAAWPSVLILRGEPGTTAVLAWAIIATLIAVVGQIMYLRSHA